MGDKEQQLLDALIREVALNGGSVAAGLSGRVAAESSGESI